MEDFLAPDSGPGRRPFVCSCHWLRTDEGRMVYIDLARSEDRGCLALRVFVSRPDGQLRGFLHEAPLAAWRPFATTSRPDLQQGDVLGRGRGWVCASARPTGDPEHVAFDLTLTPEAPPVRRRPWWRKLSVLLPEDYPRVRTRGWIHVDGQRLTIDTAGPVSVHSGERLPEYAYLVTVPTTGTGAGPSVIVAAIREDALRSEALQRLTPDASVITYGLGGGGVPARMYREGTFQRLVRLGCGRRIELSDISGFPHTFLGQPTVTATAAAIFSGWTPGWWPWQWFRHRRVDLGLVGLDYRGPHFASRLES